MNKIFSLLLAAVLALSMCGAALADGQPTVTVSASSTVML